MTSNSPPNADQLRAEIAALQQAIAALAALPDMQRPLREQLAAKERELAALREDSAPAARTHTQTIGDSARVGVAIAGDVHGGVSHVEQSGGINFGSGNRIGSIGDIVAGDKVMGDKVLGDKIVGSREGDYGALPAGSSEPEHIRRLIDRLTRRLRVLEEQAASAGYGARPEVLTEIVEIRAEIARLKALPGV